METENLILYKVAKAGGSMTRKELVRATQHVDRQARDTALAGLEGAGNIESGLAVTGKTGRRPTVYRLTTAGNREVKRLVKLGWIAEPAA